MVKHMKLMGVAGAILLVVAGAAVASNMGFKFTANIATGDPDIYDISIPLNNNYTTLESVYGSSDVANDFNLKNKVYEAKLDPAAFIEPELVNALK